MRVVVLVAGKGTRMGSSIPKPLTNFAGKPLLVRQLESLRPWVSDIALVTGYAEGSYAGLARQWSLTIFKDESYRTGNMVSSLLAAREWFDGKEDLLVSYGDIAFSPRVVRAIIDANSREMSLPVNTCWRPLWEARFNDPLTDVESLRMTEGRVSALGARPSSLDDVEGQYMGMIFIPKNRQADLIVSLQRQVEDNPKVSMTEALSNLIEEGMEVRPIFVNGGWLEVDTPSDLLLYIRLLADGSLHKLIHDDQSYWKSESELSTEDPPISH